MDINNLKKDTVYVLNKNEGVVAVFDKDDEDTLIDPRIEEVQNSESKLIFQVPATSEKWKSTYNPENLYLVNDKVFSANFTDSIERERTDENEDLITVVAYERQKLLEREYVRAWNSETGFENIDDFMVVIVSGGDLPLKNNGTEVITTHTKGTSGYVLEGLLYGTGWSVGTCDVTGVFDLETDQETIYSNILKVQEIWGGILVFDSLNKVVHHRNETIYLPYSGYEVRYQKNLQSSKYIGDNKIITELCPLGEGGLNIKDVNNGSLWLTNYTYTDSSLKGIENNPDIFEQDKLKAWGQRKLQELCKPRRELTMTTALLKNVEGYENEEVHLNDIVDVIDFEFVEDRVTQLRVIEYKYYLWSGADADLVIGDITLESTDIFKRNIQATNLINNGTLDTSRVVDYYKNGKSLNKILREVDQVIVDTKSELTQTDDEIKASVEQTITRVDNLNNDVISQDQKISELIINVEGIETQVSMLADLTDTISSNNGIITLIDAVEGYLYGLSVHGYDGSFRANYFSEDVYFSEDIVFADNELAIQTETENKFPSNEEQWEVITYKDVENNLTQSIITTSGYNSFSISYNLSTKKFNVGVNGSDALYPSLHFLEILPNTTYQIKLKDESKDTKIAVGTYDSTLLEWMEECSQTNLGKNCLYSYGNVCITDELPHLNYNYSIKTIEFKTTGNIKYLVIPSLITQNDLNNWILIQKNDESKTKHTYELKSDYIEVDEDYSMFLSFKGEDIGYKFNNIEYYDENKDLLYTYYQYFNRNIEDGLNEVKILFPNNTKYMKIQAKNFTDDSTYSVLEMIEKSKPMLEYCSEYKNDNTYSGELPDNRIRLDSLFNYNVSTINNNLSLFTNKTELEMQFKDLGNSNVNSALLGSDTTGFVFYNKHNGSYLTKKIIYNNTEYSFNTDNNYFNVKTTLTFKNNILKLKDELGHEESITIPEASEDFSSIEKLALFRANVSTIDISNVEVYYFKMWENSELIYDKIPCFYKTGQNMGYTGLYDKVLASTIVWGITTPGAGNITYFLNPKTEFIKYNTKTYRFLLDDELREIITDGENVASTDIDDYTLGGYNISTGQLQTTETSDGKFTNKELIEIFAGDKIHLSLSESENYRFISFTFYDENKTFLGTHWSLYEIDLNNNPKDIIFTVLPETHYIGINIQTTDSSTPYLENMLSSCDFQMKLGIKVYDEFTIQDKKATVIRRIGVTDQGELYELTNPQYILIGDADINIVQGDNNLKILHYTPKIIVEYVKKNQYTKFFASTVELETSIKQSIGEMDLKVSKKVNNNEIIARINMAVLGNDATDIPEDIDKSIIEIIANKISILSDYFELTPEGKITATAGKIAGWIIEEDRLSNKTSEIINVSDYDLDDGMFNGKILRIGKNLGATGDDAFAVYGKGGVVANSLELRALSNTTRYPAYIKIYAAAEQTGTLIESDSIDTGHGIFGDGIAKGYCMHSPDIDIFSSNPHTYFCHYNSPGNGALTFCMDVGRNPTQSTFTATNWWISNNSSDERLKHDIEPISEDLLKVIDELELKQFVYNSDNEHIVVGAIAQDFLKIVEKYGIHKDELDKYEIVRYGINKSEEVPEGYMAIDYQRLQLLKIKVLENKYIELENKYNELLEKIKKLEGEK